jgi:hypothetical protein
MGKQKLQKALIYTRLPLIYTRLPQGNEGQKQIAKKLERDNYFKYLCSRGPNYKARD